MNSDQMKTAINTRMQELNSMEAQNQTLLAAAQKQMNDAQANIFAIGGAKQDCLFWLEQIAKAALNTNALPPTTPPPPLPSASNPPQAAIGNETADAVSGINSGIVGNPAADVGTEVTPENTTTPEDNVH